MKKLALLAAVAVVGIVPAAHAETGYTKQRAESAAPGHSYTIVDREMEGDTVRYTTTTKNVGYRKVDTGSEEPDFTGRYNLANGQVLQIEGTTAYLANNDGDGRFYAPKGAYVTQRGETFYTEDGQILRMEAPPEVVYLDTNDIVAR